MSTIPFTKMQAQGNDFIFVDRRGVTTPEPDWSILAQHLCDRHMGVGADGLVVLADSTLAQLRMVIFNSDGSRAAMCGSALRCTVAVQSGNTAGVTVAVETDTGIKSGTVLPNGDIRVNLGQPSPGHGAPVAPINGHSGIPVNMGNPHLVIFDSQAQAGLCGKIGPELQGSELYPDGINVELVQVVDKHNVKIWIWERGVGPTMACGTGAGATVYAGFINNILDKQVTVIMPGGKVLVEYLDNQIYLSGPVHTVFTGVFLD